MQKSRRSYGMIMTAIIITKTGYAITKLVNKKLKTCTNAQMTTAN